MSHFRPIVAKNIKTQYKPDNDHKWKKELGSNLKETTQQRHQADCPAIKLDSYHIYISEILAAPDGYVTEEFLNHYILPIFDGEQAKTNDEVYQEIEKAFNILPFTSKTYTDFLRHIAKKRLG